MVSSTIKKLTIEKNLQTTTVTYKQQQLPTNNNSYLQTTTVTYKQQPFAQELFDTDLENLFTLCQLLQISLFA